MTNCLGIYVEKSFVKYAKLQKEKDNIKIVAFNVEFYEDLKTILTKIINETNSSKTPISINISDELYNQFVIQSSFNINHIKKSIQTVFEEICAQEKYDNSLFDTRYVLTKSKEEKYNVLHVATKKSDIEEKKQLLSKYYLQSITPISTSIVNLINIQKNGNIAIINIEDKTKITTIVEGQIYSVDILEEGMKQIIDRMNKSEDFIGNAYEACKNLIAYTKYTQNLDEEDNDYVKKIMPILHNIVTKTKKIIDNPDMNITQIYITGTGVNINNIDLYFQEYILNTKCEILKPFFLETTSIKTTIKEYIEVNSAIALALNGLGYLKKELNFEDKLSYDLAMISQGLKKSKKNTYTPKKLSISEKLLLRICLVFIIFIVGFLGFSNTANKILEERKEAITEVSDEILEQYTLMDEDLNQINSKAEQYTRIIENVKSLTEVEEDTNSNRIISKDSIPNMLNKIMVLIPKQVKIISITNLNNSKQIIIEAESEKYEQLGYFSSILKTENVLKDIKSTSGTKEGSVVRVTIEGELP